MPLLAHNYTCTMSLPRIITVPKQWGLSTLTRIRHWWQRLAPHRQDRLAVLAPLVAVLLFFAAIIAALGYLRLEEMDREQQAVQRDVEYTQQRLRMRLLVQVGFARPDRPLPRLAVVAARLGAAVEVG